MKTLTIFTVLLTLAISFSSFVVSRQLPAIEKEYNKQNISNFRVHRQGKGVALSWSATPGAVSFRVEYSPDGEFFETLAEMENTGVSICRYKHENVFPGISYYRVISIDANGFETSSIVQSVKIMKRG